MKWILNNVARCAGKEGQEMLEVFRKTDRFLPSPETKAIVEAKVQYVHLHTDLFSDLAKVLNLYTHWVTHKHVNTMHSFAKCLSPPLFVLFFRSCDKVYQEQEVGFLFSSPFSYCDRPLSVIRRRPLSVVRQLFYLNIFSSETTHRILTKLHRNDPWVVPYQNCWKGSDWLHSRSRGQKVGFQNALFKNLFVWSYKAQSFHF